MLSTNQISKSYGNLQILKGVSISVNKGEIISIVGPSGAGKSTLLHIIGTLDKPDTGNVSIDGVDVFPYQPESLHSLETKRLDLYFSFIIYYQNLQPSKMFLCQHSSIIYQKRSREKSHAPTGNDAIERPHSS